jgi:hypothetical protein
MAMMRTTALWMSIALVKPVNQSSSVIGCFQTSAGQTLKGEV